MSVKAWCGGWLEGKTGLPVKRMPRNGAAGMKGRCKSPFSAGGVYLLKVLGSKRGEADPPEQGGRASKVWRRAHIQMHAANSQNSFFSVLLGWVISDWRESLSWGEMWENANHVLGQIPAAHLNESFGWQEAWWHAAPRLYSGGGIQLYMKSRHHAL